MTSALLLGVLKSLRSAKWVRLCCLDQLENVDGASTARGRNLTVSHSVRCERCGDLDPIDRNLCDGPCRRWVGNECYDMYDSAVAFVDVFCFDCRPPAGDGRPSDSFSL